MSGLGGMLMQGMVWGAGGEVARRAIDSVAGPRTMEVHHTGEGHDNKDNAAPQSFSQACQDETYQFNTCIGTRGNQLSDCQFYFDVMNQCKNAV